MINVKSISPGSREWLQQAVLISLFTDARASEEVAADVTDRRGHWADYFLQEQGGDSTSMGSLLWTLKREKITQAIINRARDICYDALQWLTDTSYVRALTVSTERYDYQTIAILVTITLPDNSKLEVTEKFNAV